LFQWEFLGDLLKQLKSDIYTTSLETTGTPLKGLEHIIDFIDEVSLDVKLPSVWGMEFDIVNTLTALSKLTNSGVNVWLKCVVLADTNVSELERMAKQVSRITDDIYIYLQPLTDASTSRIIGDWNEYRAFEKIISVQKYLPKTHFLPQVHKLLKWR